MKINLSFWDNSLKNRVTLTTLIIALSVIWSLAYYSMHMLRKDTQALLEEQQLTTVSFIVTSIEDEINDRFEGLKLISQSLGSTTLKNATAVQALLEQRQLLQQYFNAGAFVTGVDGLTIASVPVSLGRVGRSYLDRDFITTALNEGRPFIGKPVIGKVSGNPIISMAVPIRNAQNKIIGVLAGAVDLSKPNFLNNIAESRYGKTGGYTLLSQQHRLIVTASNKTSIMQPLPAVGVNPTLDRLLQGDEGAAIYHNTSGVEVLSTAKKIPSSGWILELTLPTKEAFSPIEEMQQRLLLATVMLTLVAGVLTWWMLRRQLAPMLDAINAMSASSTNDMPSQMLSISRQDEIGKLLESFNRLLKTLTLKGDELRTSENRSRAIIDASPVPLAINDAQGNITFINQAFIKTLGYILSDIPTLADWWPRAYPDLVYRQEVANRWQKNLDDIKQSKQAFAPLELSIHCKDDAERTFIVSAAPLGENFAGDHLVILFDITERKRTELALLTSSKTLEEAQQIAHIGNWHLDLVSGQLFWSDEIFRLFELDPNNFGASYEAFLNAIHPEDRAAVNHAYTNSLVTRAPYEITHRLLMRDGRIKWVTEKCTSTFDSVGKPLQSNGMVQDITVHKLAEQALISARDKLMQQQKAVDTHAIVSLTDLQGTILYANEKFCQLSGYSGNELIGQNHRIIKSGRHPAEFYLQMWQTISEGNIWQGEVCNRAKNGHLYWVETSIIPFLGDDGLPYQYISIRTDITKLKQNEKSLQVAIKEADAASRAKSEFLASMSHELRTPLNAILGFSQLFGMDKSLTQATRDNARLIERAGEHLLSLVNDLIDLARIEAGKVELSIEPVNLKGLVEDSLYMVQAMADKRGIKIGLKQCDVAEVKVLADFSRLRQSLINLLSNAIKYNSPQGSVKISCEIILERVRISVSDTGSGIATDKQARIFNAFDRLGAERGEIEGTGIGLVITKRIMEAMGGGVGFESTVGQGSTFWLEIPFLKNAAVKTPLHDATDENIIMSQENRSQLVKKEVLYVEDNPMNFRLMQQIFDSRPDWNLNGALNAESGLESAQSNPPALILLDINLPGMDGYQALARLKALPATAQIPVIAVSANAMKGDRERGLQAGFVDYVTKPLDVVLLVKILKKILD